MSGTILRAQRGNGGKKMTEYKLQPIGIIQNNEDGCLLELKKEYIPALAGIEGFSHLQLVWWFSDFADAKYRMILDAEQPYKYAPEKMGIFATRSPIRPNPIALSVVQVLSVDVEKGILSIPYIDANDQTPLIDIKPYTPSLDRVEAPRVPSWCHHWPNSLEESADFNWENEFNF